MKYLYDYQKKVINSDTKTLICNWSRNLGATYTLARLILDKKLEFVVYIGDFETIKEKIDECIRMLNLRNEIKSLRMNRDDIEIQFFGTNNYIRILSLKQATTLPQNRYIEYDYILFDKMLPFNTGLKTKQVISMVTINNHDKTLQKLYPKYKSNFVDSYELDYTVAIENGLLSSSFIHGIMQENKEVFYNEYAILSDPNEQKKDDGEIIVETNLKIDNFNEVQKQFEELSAKLMNMKIRIEFDNSI